jgi:hypothetical protein
MKSSFYRQWVLWFVVLSLSVVAMRAAAPVYFALAVHSEDTHHPATPDYVSDKAAFTASRAALLNLAGQLAAKDVRWNWQGDWNFLLGVKKYEVDEPDASLLAATGGTNVIRFLHEGYGVEMDPHSHENDGYNFADVAYLLTVLGVHPSGVVGGHVWDPTDAGYQDWPRFIVGLPSRKYPGAYVWQPHLLMGEGTGQHRNDVAASGIWFPSGTNSFFTPAATGAIADFGTWTSFADPQKSPLAVTNLIPLVEAGTLPAGHMWTAGLVLGQSDFTTAGWFANTFTPLLDQIVTLRDRGAIQVVQLEEAYQLWQSQFARRGAVYLKGGAVVVADEGTNSPPVTSGQDFITFSINTQDFAYPELSAATLNRLLDLHERLQVPVDVFLTTWMVDLYERDFPQLLGRLTNSPVVALSYHTRPPLPYRTGFDWQSLSNRSTAEVIAVVQDYETHGLDLVTGQPTAAPGGYTKLAALAGYAPFLVGVESDAAIAAAVTGVFRDYGARFQVNHGRALNLGATRLGLRQKPEHEDLRLFEKTNQEPARIIADAFARAHATATNGGAAPWFVGVKMHDNDFFAQDSAWLTTYLHRLSPPWNLSRKSALLDAAGAAEMWRLYEGVLNYVATNRTTFQPVNARGLLALLGTNGPTTVQLASGAVAENLAAGSVIGHLSANVGGPMNFRLLAGEGDRDNALVILSGAPLATAAPLDFESTASLSIRVRAMDPNGLFVDVPLVIAVQNDTTEDTDQDGFTEAEEQLAGTDPNDPTSALRSQLAAVGDGLTLSWSSVIGRRYVLQGASDVGGPWIDLPDSEWTATATRSVRTVTLGNEPSGFLRVRVVP